MKKSFLSIVFLLSILSVNAQSKVGVRIGYIDMDYILENVPDYKEASTQLDTKAQKWKQDIESKKNDITKLKENLKSEKALLTKELIEEREEEIKFLETDLIDYQQKRFGPRGDLAIQKQAIVKPVQDQVFTAVQDIAEAKAYDFIFDKASAMTMLFSAKKFDISDQVIRTITRAEKREEMSKKQQKALEEKQESQDVVSDNPALAERQRLLDEKKAAVKKAQEARIQAAEQKKKDYEARRKKLLEEQKAKKSGTTIDSTSPATPVADKQTETFNKIEDKKIAQDSVKATKEAQRQEAIEKNKKTLEERRKALEEKKKKILADRETARKAQEEKLKEKKN
ncbi:OmpH family outer membrane protein [Flavobacterium amnicola]|uniref:OmpH family outer membrane protein n=1 Tax=Flavobacterium amnicola TaxID=2506422 RepID=A0A4Q1K7I1_9FLAO|nr:OmpH family outer membrane protein [Flavobacterium amnicola]RXR21224.1 OmpH family outer membrane protein [Flavobacterium amnicola]